MPDRYVSRLARGLLIVGTISYPGLVYLSLDRLQPKVVALLLGGLAMLRWLARRDAASAGLALASCAIAVWAGVAGSWVPLKLYPVIVNAVLLLVFGTSLLYPPSVVERLARLSEPVLPPEAVHYTRRVTQVWCGFFMFNGLMAAATARWGDDAIWALYNGLIAYVLMGLLLAGEWLVRRWVRRAHG